MKRFYILILCALSFCLSAQTLSKPDVTNDAGIAGNDFLLLRYDEITLTTTFTGVQPDEFIWYKDGVETTMPAKTKGSYYAVGYRYWNDHIIDEAFSDTFNIDFVHPLHSIIFKSWAGSNDGNPRRIDTLIIDTCVREYIIDTLVFAVGDNYKYQIIPVIWPFSKDYRFRYSWQLDNYAIVQDADSVLEFNPIGFQHSGSYRLISTQRAYGRMGYRASPLVITAHNTSNMKPPNDIIEYGDVYGITGVLIKQGVSGRLTDIVRTLQAPKGIYILKTNVGQTFKFVKQ